jgi:hypothetical protein
MASHLDHNAQESERPADENVLSSRAFRARSEELPDGLNEGGEERRREGVGIAVKSSRIEQIWERIFWRGEGWGSSSCSDATSERGIDR